MVVGMRQVMIMGAVIMRAVLMRVVIMRVAKVLNIVPFAMEIDAGKKLIK